MDDSRIWLYAAMIVIYFIAWILKKIKGVTSGEEEIEEPERGRTQAEVQENRKRHLERQAQRKAKAEDPSEVLRNLFESISGEVEHSSESFLPEADPTPQKPPPLQKSQTPPPLTPPPLKPSPKTGLSAAEKQALARLKAQKTTSARKRKTRTSRSLHSMIRGSGLRQSVVLKEILDKPRALRPY